MAIRQLQGGEEFSRPLYSIFAFGTNAASMLRPNPSFPRSLRRAAAVHPRKAFPARAVARRFIVDERVIRDPMMRRVVGADFVFLSSPRPSMSTAAFAISRTGWRMVVRLLQ